MKRIQWIYLFAMLLFGIFGLLIVIKSSQEIIWVSVNPLWLLISLSFLFLWWFFDSLSVLTIFKGAGIKIKLSLAIKSMLVGFFFGSITPFNTGTIPAIILYLRSQKIPVRDCMSPVLMKSLMNGITRAIASLLLALYLRPVLSGKMGTLIQGILLAYGSLILLFYFILINPSSVANHIRSFLKQSLLLIGKKFSKFYPIFASLGETIQHSPDRFSCFRNPIQWMPLSFGYIFLFWLAQLSLPYFILLSIGIRTNFINTASTQASFYLLAPYLPTPGGSGMAEIGYGLLTKSLGGQNNPLFVFLWRLISFYLPLFLGGIFFMENLPKKNKST
jgi:uncharacterized protein (TIRG00374 family)